MPAAVEQDEEKKGSEEDSDGHVVMEGLGDGDGGGVVVEEV